MDEKDYLNLVRATNLLFQCIDDQTNSNSTITGLNEFRFEVYGDSRVEVHGGSIIIELNGCSVKFHIGSNFTELNNCRLIYLPDYYEDFPEAKTSMNPEDITCSTKSEGPILDSDLLERYEKAVKDLQKYLRTIDALADHLAHGTITFPTGGGSAVGLAERLAKDKQDVNKLIHVGQEVLAKAKEHADEEAIIE